VFSKSFCSQFIKELKHFEESDVPKGRPNTMNNTGVRKHIIIKHIKHIIWIVEYTRYMRKFIPTIAL